jgi:hypothetical protein
MARFAEIDRVHQGLLKHSPSHRPLAFVAAYLAFRAW